MFLFSLLLFSGKKLESYKLVFIRIKESLIASNINFCLLTMHIDFYFAAYNGIRAVFIP